MADPITLGGGGGKKLKGKRTKTTRAVFIDFDGTTYPDPGGTLKKKLFEHKFSANMKSLIVKINGHASDLTTLVPDPVNGDCTVTIKCKGDAEKIEVGSNPISVKLHTGKYPPEAGNHHQSGDHTNFIKSVTVDSPLGSFERKNLTEDDIIDVVAER